jgi:hypothetical protein
MRRSIGRRIRAATACPGERGQSLGAARARGRFTGRTAGLTSGTRFDGGDARSATFGSRGAGFAGSRAFTALSRARTGRAAGTCRPALGLPLLRLVFITAGRNREGCNSQRRYQNQARLFEHDASVKRASRPGARK